MSGRERGTDVAELRFSQQCSLLQDCLMENVYGWVKDLTDIIAVCLRPPAKRFFDCSRNHNTSSLAGLPICQLEVYEDSLTVDMNSGAMTSRVAFDGGETLRFSALILRYDKFFTLIKEEEKIALMNLCSSISKKIGGNMQDCKNIGDSRFPYFMMAESPEYTGRPTTCEAVLRVTDVFLYASSRPFFTFAIESLSVAF